MYVPTHIGYEDTVTSGATMMAHHGKEKGSNPLGTYRDRLGTQATEFAWVYILARTHARIRYGVRCNGTRGARHLYHHSFCGYTAGSRIHALGHQFYGGMMNLMR